MLDEQVQEENIQELVEPQEEIKKKSNILLRTIVSILVITNVLTIAYFVYSRNVKLATVVVPEVESEKQEEVVIVDADNDKVQKKDGNLANKEIYQDNERETIVTNKNRLIDYVDLNEGEILIEWNNSPVKIDSEEFLGSEMLEKIFMKNREAGYFPDTLDEFSEKIDVYDLGIVLNGKSKNQSLYNVHFFINKNEMGSGQSFNLRLIKDKDGFIILDNYSANNWDFYQDIFTLIDDSEILNLEPPTQLDLAEFGIVLKTQKSQPIHSFFPDVKNLDFMFEYQERKYYRQNNSACIVTSANDGTYRIYDYELDFVVRKEKESFSLVVPYALDIIWDDGSKNTEDYNLARVSGCGGVSSCYEVADYIKDENDLKIVGKTVTGDEIYAFEKDRNTNLHLISNTKIEEENILNLYPLIFWQDPFGDFIEFKNARYQPMAECGKPVIYLYPEEEMDVSVYVEPNGGFTVTEPAYEDGWKVKAKPDGELYNYSDETIYPYLFWEGYAHEYYRPNQGFVIARESVEKFLVEKLAKLGLVEHEYDEFIEFWLPKMRDRNYYFVTFMPKEEFDVIAPLSVYPKPDTVIRVFMDYEGLDNYISVEEQTIVTPERIGFTVVEWGGALHK